MISGSWRTRGVPDFWTEGGGEASPATLTEEPTKNEWREGIFQPPNAAKIHFLWSKQCKHEQTLFKELRHWHHRVIDQMFSKMLQRPQNTFGFILGHFWKILLCGKSKQGVFFWYYLFPNQASWQGILSLTGAPYPSVPVKIIQI